MNCIIGYYSTILFKCLIKIASSQCVMWAISALIKNPTLVDVAWGLNHFIIGYSIYSSNQLSSILGMSLLTGWFIRLSGFLFYFRIYRPYVDPRYEQLSRNRNKILYYFFQFQFQGILICLFTSTPLYFILTNKEELRSYNFVGVFLSLVGIIGETISDFQLQKFKNEKEIQGEDTKGVFRKGLFKKARHPNLFFELVFWFGMGLIGFNHTEMCSLFSFFGPVSLWAIMYFLTIPITTRHMLKTRENYDKVIAETNTFIPF